MVVLLTAVMIPTGTRKMTANAIARTNAQISVCNGAVLTKITEAAKLRPRVTRYQE